MYMREGRVSRVMDSIVSNLRSVAEIIIVDDASRDSTLDEICEWSHALQSRETSICRVTILHNRWAQFETYSDVVGFSVASAPYLLEIQADMVLNDPGFERRMVRALEQHDDLVAVSGRGVHRLVDVHGFRWDPWVFGTRLEGLRTAAKSREGADSQPIALRVESTVFPDAQRFRSAGRAGRLGSDIEIRLDAPTRAADKVWVGETIMRGPIAFHRQRYETVGGFDTVRFFLGYDDHDFCARALLAGYRVGFVPVEFVSRLCDGTSRRKRSLWTRMRIAGLLVRQRVLYRSSGLGSVGATWLNGSRGEEIRDF